MKNNRHYLHVVLLALVFVIGLYIVGITEIDKIIAYFGHLPEEGGITNNDRGTFGDSTGFINTLFSSLAFAGVILTLYWQIKENSNSKEEGHRKQFEDVFFHMTENFETIIAGLRIEMINPYNIAGEWELQTDENAEGKHYVEGREVFRYLYEQQYKEGAHMTDAINATRMEGYERFMEGQLDHYFRYFYRILRYIDDNKLIDSREKYRYACLLRAHMSSYELLIMHYNGLSSIGRMKLKPLLERYSMLNNIREDKLAQGSIEGDMEFLGEENYYEDSAFNHQWESTQDDVDKLLGMTLWTAIFTAVIVPLVLPLWNRIVVNIFVSHISGDSILIMLLITLLAAYHGFHRWTEDSKLLEELVKLRSPTEEAKYTITKRVIKRCKSLVPITVILLATIIMWVNSDYCLTGKWSMWDLVACYLPIAYEILILILIRNEVSILSKEKNIKLFS